MVDPKAFAPRVVPQTSGNQNSSGEEGISPPKLPLNAMGVPNFGGGKPDEQSEMSPSFQTPNASVFTPQSTKKGGTGNEDTFGLRIFGRAQTKKKIGGMTPIKTQE